MSAVDEILLDQTETLETDERTEAYSGQRSRTTRPANAPWLAAVMEQLEAIASLRRGWDGDGARRPLRATVESAKHLLALVAQSDCLLPKPAVDPTRAGGVQFSWESGSSYFEVEVNEPYKASTLYVNYEAKTEEEQVIEAGATAAGIVRCARLVAM